MATNPYTGMNLVNTWDPQSGLYYDASGNEVSGDEFYQQQSIATAQALGGATPFATQVGQTLSPTNEQGWGLYNMGNGLMTYAPPNDPNFMPQPKDTGLGWEAAAGHPSNYREAHGGLSIMALPFVGAAITAGLGGAGAAGAGAGEGTAAGAGATDASTGLFAGESATAGTGTYGTVGGGATGAGAAAGAGSGGTVSGSSGSETVAGGAGSDTGGTVGEEGYFDDFSGQWVDSSSGGGTYGDPDTTGAFDQGGSEGVFDSQGNPLYTSSDGTLVNSSTVQEVARQLGITPAAALRYLMSTAGGLAAAGLGAYGANKQANSLEALNQRYMNMGAPSRARYEASYQPGFTMANDPGYTDALNAASKATLHGLSVQGNPAGSPNAWNQTLSDVNAKFAYPALQNYRNQNAATGGIASFSAAAPAAATGAIGAQGNVYNAIGGGLNDIFNPPKSLAQQLAEMRAAGAY